MTIARIENGSVVELRAGVLDAVPEHKRHIWRSVVDQPPAVDIRVSTCAATGWQITDTHATRIYEATARPRHDQIHAIKAECQRRIIAATGAADIIGCLIKQQNGLAPEVQAELDRLRAKSNAIEALDPLPADWASDARWSA